MMKRKYLKLDPYNYQIKKSKRTGRIEVVVLRNLSDFDVGNIASNFNRFDGWIYVDGYILRLNNFHTKYNSSEASMAIQVNEEKRMY